MYFRVLNKKRFKGFTLTESLLYIAIVSVILTAIVSFYAVVMSTDDRNQTVSSLDQNGLQIAEYITTAIRNAESISNPEAGQPSSSITFTTNIVENSPVVIDLNSGKIRVKEGTRDFINLSSNNLVASDLVFKNLTPESSKQSIKFQFTLSYINPDNKKSLDYSQIFYGSATLR